MHTSSEHLWYLVSLKLSGEAGPDDLAELEKLLQATPEAVFQVEMLEKLWRQQNKLPQQKIDEAYSRHLQRLSNHLSEPAMQYTQSEVPLWPDEEEAPARRTYWWWLGGVAASLLVGIVLFFTLENGGKGKALSQNVVSTRLGSKSKVQLPDGTVVHLNSGSLLTYDQAFNGRLREVRLSGEAFFDVAHNKDRPFIIHTASVDIKVLGTAFNVRAYPDEQTTETALIRGSVEVMLLDNPDKKIVLKPSEKLVVQNKRDTVAVLEQPSSDAAIPLVTISKVHNVENDSTVLETSWVDNKLAFDNESLETIAQKLERWYDVRIVITSEQLKKETYKATFEGESLEEVLNSLKIAGGFSFVINKKEVRIMP
jgi:ferric-dicitrate binding protein FerR (iron transport regulator)